MSIKICIAILVVSTLITVQCFSLFYDFIEEAKKHSIEETAKAMKYKHPRCFAPNGRINCNITIYPFPEVHDYFLYRWSYQPLAKACMPWFLRRPNSTQCAQLKDLLTTKKQCEDLCGEPCTVVYANKMTEPGICMYPEDCHIPVPDWAPKPCRQDSRCCPRGYQMATTTAWPRITKEPMTPFNTQMIFRDVYPRRGNVTQ